MFFLNVAKKSLCLAEVEKSMFWRWNIAWTSKMQVWNELVIAENIVRTFHTNWKTDVQIDP